jgi:protein phosphatase
MAFRTKIGFMKIIIPELSLVMLIGPFGSGKTTFAQRHFKSTEILSTDFCRALVSNEETNQAATKDAYDVLHFITAKRLEAGRLTVVDATNIQAESRRSLLTLARKFHCIPIALVFDIDVKVCQERNQLRKDRNIDPHLVYQQTQQLRHTLRNLRREGFRSIYHFRSPEDSEKIELHYQSLWANRKFDTGPFDIIGDIHGCFDELCLLIEKLGYRIQAPTPASPYYQIQHPQQRKLVFLGDLVDRGPKIPEVLHFVIDLVEQKQALLVSGNHEKKLARKLKGRETHTSYGIKESIRQLATESQDFQEKAIAFIDNLPSHYVLDEGKLVVVHAGLRESMHGRSSAEVRSFALYGERSNRNLKVKTFDRLRWAKDYRGQAYVVYGHIPVFEPRWLNRTLSIDTGCVFGGKLTALRYPEKELVSVDALKTYCYPPKHLASQLPSPPPPLSPFLPEDEEDIEPDPTEEQDSFSAPPPPLPLPPASSPSASAPHKKTEEKKPVDLHEEDSEDPNELESKENGESEEENEDSDESEESSELQEMESPLEDHFYIESALGKRLIRTRFYHHIVIREESSIATLEILSRFVVNPRWLIYLSPTISPGVTSRRPDILEHPSDIFSYYQRCGVPQVLCQEKHTGSPVVFILCKTKEVAQKRFNTEEQGICYNALGQRILSPSQEEYSLNRLLQLCHHSKLWEELQSDWLCIEGVLCPYSQERSLYSQHFPLSAIAHYTYEKIQKSLEKAQLQGARVQGLSKYYQERTEMVSHYQEKIHESFLPPIPFESFHFAPLHLLASEGQVHYQQTHLWHLQQFQKLLSSEKQLGLDKPLLKSTPFLAVDLTNPTSESNAIQWWQDEILAQNRDGVVIKSSTFVPQGKHWKIQPALKCRTPEYLRLLYGPEYTLQKNLKRLSYRKLTNKRILALKEFALGLEALERFVQNRPFSKVHECIAGILALESEPQEICI